MKIYLDTNVVSAIATGDIREEASALLALFAAFERGDCELCTSPLTGLEALGDATYEGKAQVEKVYHLLRKVPYVTPWEISFSMHLVDGRLVDRDHSSRDPIWAQLHGLGMSDCDADHVMQAIRSQCDAFVTCDGGILCRAARIQEAFAMRVRTPTQVVADGAFSVGT